MKGFDEVVADLGVKHRARAALWRLVDARDDASDAVRRGLSHPDAGVRAGCCEVLDLYWDVRAMPDLVACLDDRDSRVQWMAVHALSCERCKKDTHWAKRPPR